LTGGWEKDLFVTIFLQPEFLIWESLKVIVFSWQALPKRLPKRSNLAHITVIDAVLITKEEDFWSYVNGGDYTVSSNSNYLFFYQKFHPSSPSLVLNLICVIAQNWDSWGPLKVIVFSWKALPERLPTRSNFAHREIIPIGEAASCVGCVAAIESENHLIIFVR
jgi:hypothetical protein